MADFDDEEARAERAREFRENLSKPKDVRKRYSIASPYAKQEIENSGSVFTQSTSSVHFAGDKSQLVQGLPLENFGTNLIYRDVEEYETLSKVKNFFLKLFPQPLRNALLPPVTLGQWKKFLFIHLPIVHWLWTYRPKQLIGDLIAGITIGVTHIPQGIGFALLALLPPVFGLYSSFMPVLLYSFLGSSRHISVGTFPVVALMTGDAISRLTHDDPNCLNMTNYSLPDGGGDPCFHDACEQRKINIAVTLSLLVGILMVVMSLLRLGIITLFLSDSLVSGYTAAAAFTILITQIKSLFGLDSMEAAVKSGIANAPRRFIKYCDLIFHGRVNHAAVVTSIICIIILVAVDFLNMLLARKVKKIPIHIPAQLIVVILVTGISYGAQLSERFKLPVINDLGGIPPGSCFAITHPEFSLGAHNIIVDAIIIAIISFVINISQAKLLAKKNSYTIHPDQEFFAYGIMNFGGSFFGSFPTAGALSRTILQDATGGHTQLVGFISSGIVILVILFLGRLFGPLPNAALAAIVVVALKGLYLQVRDIYKYFKLSLPDMFVWLVVFLSTLFIGLDIGLGVGVGFSILVVVIRTILPFSPQLGEAKAWQYPPNSHEENFDEEELKVYRVPCIYIFQFNSPLYFANVSVFRSKLNIETEMNPEELGPMMDRGCIEYGCTRLCHSCSKCYKSKHSERTSSSKELVGDIQNGGYTEYSNYNEEEGDDDVFAGDMGKRTQERPYHTIIIDCAPIAFVDSMGAAMIEQVVREYDSIGVQVLLAAPTVVLCEALNRHTFFGRYNSQRLFPTVATAVAFAKDGHKVPPVEKPEKPDLTLYSNLERQLLFSTRPSLLDATPVELKHRGRSNTATVQNPNAETESSL